jgi:WD40 repeat protein
VLLRIVKSALLKTPAPERRLAAVPRPASVYRAMTDLDGPSPSSPPLPPGALARLGFRGFAHAAVSHQRSPDLTIVALAYSPDGAALASADRAGSAIRGVTFSARVEAHAGAILRVVFAPDGRWLVSSSEDRTALVWPAEPPLELWLSDQGKKSR